MAKLTPRQHEVLRMLGTGKTNEAIAGELGLSRGTIREHVKAIHRELGTHHKAEAVARYFGASK